MSEILLVLNQHIYNCHKTIEQAKIKIEQMQKEIELLKTKKEGK